LGLLFAFLGFFGFEATAVFRHEAKDPLRTIPRATYIAVLLIGVLYTVSSWLVISGLGAHSAHDAATADPDGVIVSLAADEIGRESCRGRGEVASGTHHMVHDKEWAYLL